MDYQFQRALLIGRFQPLHNGHIKMIETALGMASTVTIFIGSSQEEKTEHNPWSYTERREMIAEIFYKERLTNRLTILPLPDTDVGNGPEWGDYVMESYRAEFETGMVNGILPDLVISAKEQCRKNWYNNFNIAELSLPRFDDISATQVRQAIKNKDVEYLAKSMSRKTLAHYNQLAKRLNEIEKRHKSV